MNGDSTFTRARQPEQKEERKAQIFAAASELLDGGTIEGVSLNAIARKAKIAKSNVYRYFESREDIYLQLLKQDWIFWISALETQLEPLEGSNDIDAVTDALVNSIFEASRMCQLISVLASVLEKNLSEENLYSFKLESIELSVRLVRIITAALPAVKADNVMPAIQSIFALIGGLWPLCNPGPLVEKVLQKPELAPFKLDYKVALGQSINLVIRGAVG